jgi:hypothetical protein
LTELKKKKRLIKNTVLKFNDTVKGQITEEKLKHFIEVSETINEFKIKIYLINLKNRQ